MSETVILVSLHKEFSGAVAEQVKAELGLNCAVVADFKALPAGALVVTTEEAPLELANAVITVRKGGLRMGGLLREIAQMRLQQAEDMAFGEFFVLKARPKQLVRGQVCVDLTDKEVAIIQCLISAGAEGESREGLLKKVWGFDSSLDTHTLETHIYRLRNKIRELLREDTGEDGLIAATQGGYAMVMK